jgi:hypothetical protein
MWIVLISQENKCHTRRKPLSDLDSYRQLSLAWSIGLVGVDARIVATDAKQFTDS